MSTISLTQISNGDALDASVVDNNFDTIANDYNGSMTNANISATAAIALSKLATDAWTAWTPTFQKADGSTALTGTVTFARYVRVGRIVTATFGFAAVNNPAGALFYFTLPVTAKSETTAVRMIGSGYVAYGGVVNMGYTVIAASDTTKAYCQKYDQSVWATSADNGANMTITYEAGS